MSVPATAVAGPVLLTATSADVLTVVVVEPLLLVASGSNVVLLNAVAVLVMVVPLGVLGLT